MNRAILIGRLGRDPEVRNTQSGDSVANLSLATSERWKTKDGERKEKTEWHKIVLWGSLADVAEKYLHKGDQVCIEGKIETRKWTDQSGQDRYTTEIRGEKLEMLGGGNGERRQSESADDDFSAADYRKASGKGGSPDLDDEIPF